MSLEKFSKSLASHLARELKMDLNGYTVLSPGSYEDFRIFTQRKFDLSRVGAQMDVFYSEMGLELEARSEYVCGDLSYYVIEGDDAGVEGIIVNHAFLPQHSFHPGRTEIIVTARPACCRNLVLEPGKKPVVVSK